MIMILIYVKKAGRKLSVLARLSNYMSFAQSICRIAILILTWMFHGKRANSKINLIHQ